ncbi:dTDP-4-dehydrorhamnose 3,5-epimerase [Paenibacillus aquistagni]|uniref:dTDP-4-dehydrorhamnose 3,5-epimerase n=1 Tax=Paenibacillus aquistagni TaxID=1852522 RepID=UPI000B507169|nr:dTDP-4-dehydrorhamnose 3,5-epimerase [Paenibacillus aquistagni]
MQRYDTALDGVFVLEPTIFTDPRGFFMESYHQERLLELGLDTIFVQDNHSLSVQEGTIRGLHYQEAPCAQAKLIRVLHGSIWDVAVDIRPDSSTYGQYVAVTLSAVNKKQLYIPYGFAHGFCTLEPHTEVLYKVDAYYAPALDRGIRWDDPMLAIPWPRTDVLLSNKDRQLPYLSEL